METSIPTQKRKGVLFEKRRNKWRATIKNNRRNIFLGYFNDFESAVAAREVAEEKYFSKRIQERKEFEEKIKSLYLSGKSMAEVGDVVDRNQSSVWEVLKKLNVYTSNEDIEILKHSSEIVNLYAEGKSSVEIAKKYNVGENKICKILKRNKIKPRIGRKYEFDQSIMEKIDCEWKAYFLGLMYADGGVGKINVTISLVEVDSYILDTIKNFIFPKTSKYELTKVQLKTLYNEKRKKYYVPRPQRKLYINSKKVRNDMIALGCYPKKSLTLRFPENGIIPNELFHHFIRGYFDGDGWITLSKRQSSGTFGIISSYDFCKSYQEFIEKELNIKCFLKPAGKVCRIQIYKQEDILTLYKYMYKDSSIHLHRKKEKFELMFKTAGINPNPQ